jgi:hypothetical protein
MTVGSTVLDDAGAASMRRNTSGTPAADPADSDGRGAGIIGMPGARGESGVRESGVASKPWPAGGPDRVPNSGKVLPSALAAAASRATVGAAAIPSDTGLSAGTTLAVS